MTGVRGADPDRQLAFVEACCGGDVAQALSGTPVHRLACEANGGDGFGPVESDFLFAFIARHRPRSIVQIGCGVSTDVVLRAASFADYRPRVVCVEPFANRYLREAAAAGRIELIARPAEAVELLSLCEDDGGLLFVDSTHAVRPGGEVNRLVLEVVPRLADGWWIHFHDITFPYDYSRGLLSGDLFFSHESVLLHALLVDNRRLEIAASLSMLHYQRQDELRNCLPRYRPAADADGLESEPGDFPSSIYLRVDPSGSQEPHGGAR